MTEQIFSETLAYRADVAVDLGAVCANVAAIAAAAPGAEVAPVLKANGYGLGAAPIARALVAAHGARTFFTAHPEEGALLRKALSSGAPEATIYILNGPTPESLPLFAEAGLSPVLNSLHQATVWARACPGAPAALHVDSGMNRLGAPRGELAEISALEGLNIDLIMSHLACAATPGARENAAQREAFEGAAEMFTETFPDARRSLASSAGALIAPDFAYDAVRFGVGLYGVNPLDDGPSPIVPVATLRAEVLQVQTLATGEAVGYGGTFIAERPTRMATLALGYGDGFPRAASNAAEVFLGGARCPVIGRVSMDVTTIDVTDAPEPVAPGDRAEVYGARVRIEETAAACGTIGYELLTGLSPRVRRRYLWAEEKYGPDTQGALAAALETPS